MLISWWEPALLAVLSFNVLFAELGGVAFNGSKLFKGSRFENFSRELQFVVYAASRLLLMLPWSVYLTYSYFAQGRWSESWGLVAGSSVLGSYFILGINLKFLLIQWKKKKRQGHGKRS